MLSFSVPAFLLMMMCFWTACCRRCPSAHTRACSSLSCSTDSVPPSFFPRTDGLHIIKSKVVVRVSVKQYVLITGLDQLRKTRGVHCGLRAALCLVFIRLSHCVPNISLTFFVSIRRMNDDISSLLPPSTSSSTAINNFQVSSESSILLLSIRMAYNT